jgi:hypothetical protein
MSDKRLGDSIVKAYGVGIVAYLVLAVIAAKVMLASTFQVVTNYFTSNPLLSVKSTVFAPATHVLWSIEFRWTLILILGVSILVPAYYLYVITTGYKKIDYKKYRYLDWSVTGALMLVITAALVGIQDISLLLTLFFVSVGGVCLLWLSENSQEHSKKLYSLSFLAMGIPWIALLIYVISTWVYGSVRLPGFAYLLLIVIFVRGLLLKYSYFWKQNKAVKKDKMLEEVYPIGADLLIKIIFALTLIIGLKH